MLNKSMVQGRLTRDVELKTTGTGTSVASFAIACDRDFKAKDSDERECDFIDCVAWRQTAEFISKYFHQGDMIIVDGRIQCRSYDDQNGVRRKATEIVVSNAYFGGSKRDGGSQGGGSQKNGYSDSNPFANDGFMNIPDGIDEGLPFN